MNLRPLILDESAKARIAKLVDFAHNHPFTLAHFLAARDGLIPAAGNMDGYSIIIDMGYRIVFSIEHQPSGNVRHLSMSVGQEGKMPSVEAVMILLPLFGFTNELQDCALHIEEFEPKKHAVNILEYITTEQDEN
jgi:hypothetical protein